MVEHPEFEFFEKLQGRLHIELTKKPVRVAPSLLNEKAPSDAEIKSVRFEPYIWTGEDFRDLTAEEWERVVWIGEEITLAGEGAATVTHRAPNGAHFTVRDMVAAVAETERVARPQSDWFEGIDVHHVYYEGIIFDERGVGSTFWGS